MVACRYSSRTGCSWVSPLESINRNTCCRITIGSALGLSSELPNESGPYHRCRAAGARVRHVPTVDALSEAPGEQLPGVLLVTDYGTLQFSCVALCSGRRRAARVQSNPFVAVGHPERVICRREKYL